MQKHIQKDEILEQLWYMKENSQTSLECLWHTCDYEFTREALTSLERENLIWIDSESKTVSLTPEGEGKAKQIIRAHRIAERLLVDVLGIERENSACEFEHTINPELVDSICTLLAHPRFCPHGLSIPEGECCRKSAELNHMLVIPLTRLPIGASGRIAYIQSANDKQMHRLNGLQIQPGKTVTLHQKYPTFVVECEGATIALDDHIASQIRIWSLIDNQQPLLKEKQPACKSWIRRILQF